MNYTNEIRNDIAHNFGLEAAGYAPTPKYILPIKVAIKINAKYPSTMQGRKVITNPTALKIAQRYVSLMRVMDITK